MPVRYRIAPDGAYVTAIYEGNVETSEVAQVYADYRSDPDFDPARPHYVDLSRLVSSPATFADINATLAMFERGQGALQARLRISFYAPTDLGFGLARMFETLASMSQFIEARVFDNAKDALGWLENVDQEG